MIHFLRYRHTNCYLLREREGVLAFDAGWPGSYNEYARAVKVTGLQAKQINWLMVSHFHIDHAGLMAEMQAQGVNCAIFGDQEAAISAMEELILRENRSYRPVDRSRLVTIPFAKSRAWLEELGIAGEVLSTPGHSPDSVSLLLDCGDALIGDLYPEWLVMADDRAGKESWQALRSRGAARILPSHYPVFDLS